MDFSYIDYLLSEDDINTIYDFYRVRTGFGKEINDYFELRLKEELPRLSLKNGWEVPFDTFRELVEAYQDHFSPLRNLSVVDDFVVITRDDKIPFTLEDFLEELKKTTLKGLRAVSYTHLTLPTNREV